MSGELIVIDEKRLKAQIELLLNNLYAKRFAALEKLTLTKLLNKNPYLYRALGIDTPEDYINQLILARISSSDETLFGNDFIEPLAMWAAQEADTHGDGRTVTVGAGAGQDRSEEHTSELQSLMRI